MPFYIQKIMLHNRAPFDHLELDFSEGGISILSSVNGGGKTTIISHIVDAWHEMAKVGFVNEYEGKSTKFYRVSSSLFSLNDADPSLFYVRFCFNDKNVDYIDLRSVCTKEQYEDLCKNLESIIPFDKLIDTFQKQGCVKYCNVQDEKELREAFSGNILTSFPAYRYEKPGYLNKPYAINLDYDIQSRFIGYLTNPIEVINDLQQIANWMMDIILDATIYSKELNNSIRLSHINRVFERLLYPKINKRIRIGLGQRNSSDTRISIGECDNSGNWLTTLYPSIFNMSSGEHALICMFIEIIRQIDRIAVNNTLENATGIVLIDEVDKHLHIKLQKEILPVLLNLFPKIQFVVSTHSPFVSMGLAEQAQTRTKIIDLDCGGIVTEVRTNDLYQEVYKMMIDENKRYKELYDKLINSDKLCQLFVEDTYSQIYKIAWLKLNDISFCKDNLEQSFDENAPFEIFDNNSCTGVAGLLNAQSVEIHRNKKIIGLFDYDSEGSERFYNLKDGFDKKVISGSLENGFYKQKSSTKHPCMYALLLPIPERLHRLIASHGNWELDCKFANYIEIETLLPESYLSIRNSEYEHANFCDFSYFKAKDKKKADLWKALVDEPKETFKDFQPLFKQIYKLFDIQTIPQEA